MTQEDVDTTYDLEMMGIGSGRRFISLMMNVAAINLVSINFLEVKEFITKLYGLQILSFTSIVD